MQSEKLHFYHYSPVPKAQLLNQILDHTRGPSYYLADLSIELPYNTDRLPILRIYVGLRTPIASTLLKLYRANHLIRTAD